MPWGLSKVSHQQGKILFPPEGEEAEGRSVLTHFEMYLLCEETPAAHHFKHREDVWFTADTCVYKL